VLAQTGLTFDLSTSSGKLMRTIMALADRGYIIGLNLALEERYDTPRETRSGPMLMAELLARNVDVLVTLELLKEAVPKMRRVAVRGTEII
jgi:hypothetical protein